MKGIAAIALLLLLAGCYGSPDYYSRPTQIGGPGPGDVSTERGSR